MANLRCSAAEESEDTLNAFISHTPEAAMGGLWLKSLMAGAESAQNCETSPASEIMSLQGHTAERITFGVESGAALTVIGKDVAAESQECRDSRDE